MKTDWYVLYTKPYSAKRISEILNRKKIENYFPVTKVVENRSIDKKITDQPLFNSYIFVRTAEKKLVDVKKVSGIINLVYWLGKPVIISDYEIHSIKRFLNDHINVKVEKITLGKEKVKEFNNLIIEEKKDLILKVINKNVNVVLPSIGYKITAEPETSNVRIISPDKLISKTNLRTSELFHLYDISNGF